MLSIEKDDGSEAAMLIRTDGPVIPVHFRERVAEAFVEISRRSDCALLLSEFKEACTYRSTYPWLVESNGGRTAEGSGALVSAFRYALKSYVPTEKHPPHVAAEGVGTSKVDHLADLAHEIAGDPGSILGFATGLRRVGLDYETPQELVTLHVIAALRNYCEEREVGTSPDPW